LGRLLRHSLPKSDQAVRARLANEERLLGALSASERGQFTRLLRKLLATEAFTDLDPVHLVERNGRAAEPPPAGTATALA
jgi:hypothetical protein